MARCWYQPVELNSNVQGYAGIDAYRSDTGCIGHEVLRVTWIGLDRDCGVSDGKGVATSSRGCGHRYPQDSPGLLHQTDRPHVLRDNNVVQGLIRAVGGPEVHLR